MVDAETCLALDEDEHAAREAASESGGVLERDVADRAVYWLTMHSRTDPVETYFARIAWTRYPDGPPSVKFADAVSGRLDVTSAWPMVPGYRPGSYDICQPFTAEGQAVHPEWATGPEAWPATGNPFLWVVTQLLHDVADRQQGRSA